MKARLHGLAYLLHTCTPASKWQDLMLCGGFMDLVAKWWPCEVGMQHTVVPYLDMLEQDERAFIKDAEKWAKKPLLACRKMNPAMWWRMATICLALQSLQ